MSVAGPHSRGRIVIIYLIPARAYLVVLPVFPCSCNAVTVRTLIFVIKTVGSEWQSLDLLTQQTLMEWIGRTVTSPDERVRLQEEVQNDLASSPLTGRIMALGLYDVERAQGAVYYVGAGEEPDETIGPYVLKQRSEVAILREFWEGAREYDTFVTFNGRTFTVPFLLHRSIAHAIRPTRELMKYRYLSQQSVPFHIDLQDELTFYGAMGKRPSLHLFCRAYGIKSPRVDGMSEDDVSKLFHAKKFRDSALYTAADVVAVTALYEKWLENLAPTSFLNTLDF